MKKKNSKKTPYIPRIVIKMNTGTRTIASKKDKANTRRNLNLELRKELRYD